MTDRHLNLFFSYNRDTELLENNLTRAWLVTMQLLSPDLRGRLLDELLGKALCAPDTDLFIEACSFGTAQFALQCHMDRTLALSCRRKYIVAMISEREYVEGSSTVYGSAENGKLPEGRAYDSVPDAWIFDKGGSYCLLVEAKIGANPLDNDQIISHATGWLGLSRLEVGDHLISLSWDYLAQVLETILQDIACGRLAALVPEQLVLANLCQYLSFFEYRAFRGIALNALKDRPVFALGYRRGIHLPAFVRLGAPPRFRLQH